MVDAADSRSAQELALSAQAGDTEAFGLLLERYRPRLEAVIHLRLGSRLQERVDIEDVLQETNFMAYRSIRKFRWQEAGSFFQWLVGIAEHVIQNLARHHFGTQKRDAGKEISLSEKSSKSYQLESGPTEIGNLIAAKENSPSKVLRRHERFKRLEQALNSLSDDHRKVIVLARLEGHPLKEIARRMDRSVDAVSMLLLRALRELRSHFGSTDSMALPSRGLDVSPGGTIRAVKDEKKDERPSG